MQFAHRVKSVTLAEYKADEVEHMRQGGNQVRCCCLLVLHSNQNHRQQMLLLYLIAYGVNGLCCCRLLPTGTWPGTHLTRICASLWTGVQLLGPAVHQPAVRCCGFTWQHQHMGSLVQL
jgi:hypothetical protein